MADDDQPIMTNGGCLVFAIGVIVGAGALAFLALMVLFGNGDEGSRTRADYLLVGAAGLAAVILIVGGTRWTERGRIDGP